MLKTRYRMMTSAIQFKRGAFMLKKTSQKGFTIVELLIVIVVIGILAVLVLNTFNGVQQKARNSERQTDTTSVSKQLEAYFAENGGYPQFSQFGATPTTASTFLKGTSPNAYQAPGISGTTLSLQSSAATTKDQYGYQAFAGTGWTGTACSTNNACQSFILTYYPEGGSAAVEIRSLN